MAENGQTGLNPVSVLGMGQCGSNIAFDLSIEIDPLAPFAPPLAGLAKINISLPAIDFSKMFRRNSPDSSRPFYADHDFYIGDMNVANESYNKGLKISAIRDFLLTSPTGSYEELLSTPEVREIPFNNADKDIFDAVKKNPSYVANVELLSFRRADSEDFYRDGAGGLQFISEYLAVHDSDLYSKIKQRDDGTMIGVFSAGGGTGAGSVFGILSKYKRDSARYTLGLCVLPARNEGDSSKRAGRFLARYLSTSKPERFDTLLLFSNYAAMTVASDYTQDLDEAHTTALAAVNRYLTRFTYYYSILNRPSTRPLLSKVFDPADGRSVLCDPSFVGFSVGESGDSYDPSDLFLRAFSPAHFESGYMRGLGVSFGSEGEIYKQIHSLLRQIFAGVRERKPVEDAVAELTKVTKFYKTLKRLLVFFFVQEDALATRITDVQNALSKFVDSLTGGKVTISLMAYSGRHVRENCVMVLCSGGLTLELHQSFLAYIKEAFFSSDDERFRLFSKSFMGVLASCHAPLTSNKFAEKKEEVSALLSEYIKEDVEIFTEGQWGSIAARPSFRALVDSEEFEAFRVGKADLIEAGKALIDLARVPQVEQDISEEFEEALDEFLSQGSKE